MALITSGFSLLRQLDAPMAVLHNDVLLLFLDLGLSVQAIPTDNWPEFCGTDTNRYEIYQALNEINHRQTNARRPQNNGRLESFQPPILEKFLPPAIDTVFIVRGDTLKDNLDVWVVHYNTEREIMVFTIWGGIYGHHPAVSEFYSGRNLVVQIVYRSTFNSFSPLIQGQFSMFRLSH